MEGGYYLIDLTVDRIQESRYISRTLVQAIEYTKKQGKKTLLYINKRGHSSVCICGDCHFVFRCERCGAVLRYHKTGELLCCHHCGSSQGIPERCVVCKGMKLRYVGVGTQQIEEGMHMLFPSLNIVRIDSDIVHNRKEKSFSIEKMEKADIVIGTQMVTSDIFFKNVYHLGIILAEQSFQGFGYDTEEIVFSFIKRFVAFFEENEKSMPLVCIQTFAPYNEMIESLIKMNYKEFFQKSLKERKLFCYPPFCEIATIVYKGKRKEEVKNKINEIATLLHGLHDASFYTIFCDPHIWVIRTGYMGKIIVKGNNIRHFLFPLKNYFFQNKNCIVYFDR